MPRKKKERMGKGKNKGKNKPKKKGKGKPPKAVRQKQARKQATPDPAVVDRENVLEYLAQLKGRTQDGEVRGIVVIELGHGAGGNRIRWCGNVPPGEVALPLLTLERIFVDIAMKPPARPAPTPPPPDEDGEESSDEGEDGEGEDNDGDEAGVDEEEEEEDDGEEDDEDDEDEDEDEDDDE